MEQQVPELLPNNFATTNIFFCTKYILNYWANFVLLFFFLRTPSVFAPPLPSHPACSVATGTVLVLMSFLNFQQPLKLITRLSTGGLLSAGSERELQAALLAKPTAVQGASKQQKEICVLSQHVYSDLTSI